jgi:hypothetical protein
MGLRPPKNNPVIELIYRITAKKEGWHKMIKKLCFLAIAFMLILSGSVWANDEGDSGGNLIPDDLTYETVFAYETAQYDLVKDLKEKIGMQNEFAERRLRALEALKMVNNQVALETVLNAFQSSELELLSLVEDLDSSDLDTAADLVMKASEQRMVRLAEKSEDESLPEQARNGMKKALENQEMAMNKFREALQVAQQARETAGQPEDLPAGSTGNATPGSPNETTPGIPPEVSPGPPVNVTPGPPEGITPGLPVEVTPGPPKDINPGLPANVNPGPPGGGNRP